MTAMTLAEWAKLADTAIDRNIREKYANSTPLMQVMPFENIPGSAKMFNREGTAPTTAFRKINASYTPSNGTFSPWFEGLFIAGGEVDVDKFLVKTGPPGTREKHEGFKIKALGHNLGHAMIKGDSTTTAESFDGLQARSAAFSSDHLISAGSTSGGDPLSLALLERAADNTPGYNYVLMSKAMKRRLSAAIRAGLDAPIVTDKDQFGKPILTYDGRPIIFADGVDQLNQSLAFDEAAASGGSTATSIYFLKIGADGVHGIQNAPPSAVDFGEIQSAPVFRSRIEWYAGLVCETADCFTRVYGISDAAVVA